MQLFVPIIFLVLAAGIFFGYIDPTYLQVRTLLDKEAQYDQALTRAKDLQGTRDELLSRYNTFSQSDLDRLQKLLPDHIDNVRLILDLDTMATRYGMRVRDVSIDAGGSGANAPVQTAGTRPALTATPITRSQQIGPDSKAYESVVLSFSVSGTYDSFRQYLADLERSLRLSDVTGITFAPNDTGIYDYTIHLKTYWLKP